MSTYTYDYPRPGLTSDIVLFRFSDTVLQVLLIKRRNYPFEGYWALPGGFVDEGETAEIAAERELKEETHIEGVQLEQIFTTSTPGRDPRGWTVSVIYAGFVKNMDQVKAGDDASEADWFAIDQLPDMAFDHEEVFQKVIIHLREMIHFKIFGYQLILKDFELADLKVLYNQLIEDKYVIDKLLDRLLGWQIVKIYEGRCSFNMQMVKTILTNGWY